MSTIVIGFLLIGVGLGSLALNGLSDFFELTSVALVIGGTIAIALTATPLEVLLSLFRSIKNLFKKESRIGDYETALMELSHNRTHTPQNSHPLVEYAVELWKQGLDSELFVHLLSLKRRDIEVQGLDGIQALKNLVKYPPALGMAGTVMGMVHLFSTLDENKSQIGHHLSIAMTATFLGLLTANFFVAPLADRLQVQQVNQERLCEQLFEVLILVNQGEPAALLKDEIDGRAAA